MSMPGSCVTPLGSPRPHKDPSSSVGQSQTLSLTELLEAAGSVCLENTAPAMREGSTGLEVQGFIRHTTGDCRVTHGVLYRRVSAE